MFGMDGKIKWILPSQSMKCFYNFALIVLVGYTFIALLSFENGRFKSSVSLNMRNRERSINPQTLERIGQEEHNAIDVNHVSDSMDDPSDILLETSLSGDGASNTVQEKQVISVKEVPIESPIPTKTSVEKHSGESTEKKPDESKTTVAEYKPLVPDHDTHSPSTKKSERIVQASIDKEPKYDISFDNPKTYKGPVIQGWPPNKSRNMEVYVKPDQSSILMMPLKFRSSGVRLLVIVHSAPDFFEARSGVRNSWGQYLKEFNDTSMLFLVGRGSGVQKKLMNENKNFGDILQMDFVDSYNNLTIKTMMTLKFMVQVEWSGKRPQFLLKIDDDSYVNIRNLRELLYHGPQHGLLLGFRHGTPKKPLKPIRIAKKAQNKQYTGKWVMPTYHFNGKYYPMILSGSGYVMSFDAVKCLYAKGLKLPFLHLEDVFVTGFSRQACHLNLTHHSGFKPNPTKLETVNDKDILYHYMNLKAKSMIFKAETYDRIQSKYMNLLRHYMKLKEQVASADHGTALQKPTLVSHEIFY